MLSLSAHRSRDDRATARASQLGLVSADGEALHGDPADVREQPRLRIVLPWVVLAIGVSLSVALAIVVRDAVENVARLRFERQTSDAHAVIQDRIHSYADILYGAKAHFASLEQVTRLQFHRYVDTLDLTHRYPGFDLLNYAVHVPGADKERFERSVRNDVSLNPRGYPQFAIRPPGNRPEYYVIAYVEPMARFEFAFGLDLAANPEVPDSTLLLNALQSARDSGKLTASGVPLKLLSRKNDVGLAMRLAVYRTGMPVGNVEQRRSAYIGSVGAGFNVGSLMNGVLGEDMVPYMRFKMFDAGSIEKPPSSAKGHRLLYDSARQSGATVQESGVGSESDRFTRVRPFEVGGRVWQVHFSAPSDAVIEPIDRLLPAFVLAGGVLVSALLFGVLYSLASSRRRAIGIANEITRDLHASNEQLQALSRRLVDVQEAERRQFSRELHDQIGQNLTALSINIDILKSETNGGGVADQRDRLDELEGLVESTANAIENVMSDLRPPMLDDYGLLPALQWYGTEFSTRTGIQVHVHGDENMARLSSTTEIALFRITQEALNNVAKHAHAGVVEIRLDCTDLQCVLSISDNGIGCAPPPAPAARRRHGMGMITMRERTQAIRGRFKFDAAPGGGSRVIVHVPYWHADKSPDR